MKTSFSAAEILDFSGGRIANFDAAGEWVESVRVEKPVPLSGSGASDIAFFFSKAYQRELATAAPGILITGEEYVKPLESARLPFWNRTVVIACPDPYLAMARISEKFAGALSSAAFPRAKAGVHPTAIVDPSAVLSEGVSVGPHCVIEKDVKIGAGTILFPGCFIGRGAEIGASCVLFPTVVVYEMTEIGNRVRIHANSVLGSDGFGYAPIRSGGEVSGHAKVYHLGRVVVGDDVEIGASSCVDRGTISDTWIQKNAKLDNHVHIGHNAIVEEGAIICGGVCLAGQARIGKYAYIGGIAGISNRVHVGDGARVAAMSLISKDVPPGETAVGNPQREHSEHFRLQAYLNRLMRKSKDKPKNHDE